MAKVLLLLWQLPQSLLGLAVTVLLMAYKTSWKQYPDIYIHYKDFLSSVSLGCFVIMNGRQLSDIAVLHEKGHAKQSLYLGWLYLPLIGLPSLMGNLMHRFIKFDYYSQPWEKWADKLGGVDRH